jgi:hypothetical protein
MYRFRDVLQAVPQALAHCFRVARQVFLNENLGEEEELEITTTRQRQGWQLWWGLAVVRTGGEEEEEEEEEQEVANDSMSVLLFFIFLISGSFLFLCHLEGGHGDSARKRVSPVGGPVLARL